MKKDFIQHTTRKYSIEPKIHLFLNMLASNDWDGWNCTVEASFTAKNIENKERVNADSSVYEYLYMIDWLSFDKVPFQIFI